MHFIIKYNVFNKYIINVTTIRVITKLSNSEQSYKGKVKTHNYINRQNQSATGKLWNDPDLVQAFLNGGLNQILKRQTSRSHYGSKVPAVTITVFKYRNKIGKNSCQSSTIFSEVNVKNIFTSHIDKKISLTFFLTSLSLYIFIIWKCIVYNRFCRDGIYFDKILVSEYKLFKRSNKANLFIALVQ